MDENTIAQNLRTRTFGKNLHFFRTIDSTNSKAKEIAAKGTHSGTLVIAEEQNAGRGRLGRSWVSEKGKSLTFSVILQPHIPVSNLGIISLYAGVAVCNAIRTATDQTSECKWPNDVLIRKKKVCGILSEIVHHSGKNMSVIVGIGVNVNQSDFPPEVQSVATSLFLESGQEYDCVTILCNILEQMEELYSLIQLNRYTEIIKQWKSSSSIIGNSICVDQSGKLLYGTAKDIRDDGGLIIESENRLITVYAGDVTVRKDEFAKWY
jgi:BirA family biotin operon repressor/biotin-[acetyl-CoA-carboxylase] ligase